MSILNFIIVSPFESCVRIEHQNQPTFHHHFTQIPTQQFASCLYHCLTTDMKHILYQSHMEAALDMIAYEARNNPVGNTLGVTLYMGQYNQPLPINLSLNNITAAKIIGSTDSIMIETWFRQLSMVHIPDIVVEIPEHETIRGIGNCSFIQAAECLAIIGGTCDITDEQLALFHCDVINIKSPNITVEGMNRHIEKVRQMDEQDGEHFDWQVGCFMPNNLMPHSVVDQLFPEGFEPHSYAVRTNLGATGEFGPV